MTTTKIIILAIIFGLGILFFWLAFRKKKPKKPIQDMPIYPHTPSRPKPQPTTTTTTTTEWRETEQRRKAASEAATKMCEHRMNNRGSEAVQIRQVINQHRINVNISALNTAQDKIMRICAHAEKIRDNISRYRNNPNYLKQLYREGVGVSDEAHKLRLEIKALRDIGDCQALVMTEELEPKQLLAPVNIFRHREHTVFANSSMAANAMKVEIGSASNIAGFILVSDGAEGLCEPANADDLIQLSSVCAISANHAQTALEGHVSNVIAPATNDDITVLMTMRSNSDRITNIAKATCNTVIETDADEDEEAVSEYIPDEDVADDCIPDTDDSAGSETSSAILNFLATPRTAEEIVVAGYCIPSEVLSYIYPFIKEGFVAYDDYHFSTVKGG